ncbi:hypothetical protein HanRHA438_Chr02g0060811 [Helianthus annuus]|uniref:Uncharacterized protein n=1 Tax=Helianthus annuus TaxID=4232 RepID=A0A9K3NZ38_HELAN|nr:hypothetical protein HanXRQr2_Chr02g0058891 [Helianthus annuus]KAJ0939410.1 hypothetical protein HanRHA438_Chr02g0060811 [Helianthus annuus]KAJ0951285.1 hypothetical protein HanPSC8_Chr02g0058191 [Helianthus annuus]
MDRLFSFRCTRTYMHGCPSIIACKCNNRGFFVKELIWQEILVLGLCHVGVKALVWFRVCLEHCWLCYWLHGCHDDCVPWRLVHLVVVVMVMVQLVVEPRHCLEIQQTVLVVMQVVFVAVVVMQVVLVVVVVMRAAGGFCGGGCDDDVDGTTGRGGGAGDGTTGRGGGAADGTTGGGGGGAGDGTTGGGVGGVPGGRVDGVGCVVDGWVGGRTGGFLVEVRVVAAVVRGGGTEGLNRGTRKRKAVRCWSVMV